MNKKQLMMLFSLVFFVSMFAVGIQSGVTTSTATSYQTFEMSLTDPLYSVNAGNSGGSGCTASTSSSSYSTFSLNPSLPSPADLQASTGFMVFNGFVDEQNNGSFVPFSRDPSNTSLMFPREDQSPNFLDWSGDFQDRRPNWINVTAVFDSGTPNPLTNTTALNHLVNFNQFESIVLMDADVQNPLVVAELHWMDCDAIFESDLVINGFYDINHSFMPIKVNDSVSQFIDFTDSGSDGPPALLIPTANWYDMRQIEFNVTGVWNLTDYDTLRTVDENVLDPSNILANWAPGPDGSPEWVELTGLVSNASDLVVSVTIKFQNDCSCQRWYSLDENHGNPFLTTQIDGKGAINFTQFDFGFWESNEYHNEGAWKRSLEGVYLASEFDPSKPLDVPQPVAINYLESYDLYGNIAHLKMLNVSHHLFSGTPVVIVVLEDYCPPPPPCDIDFADIYASAYYDNGTFSPFRAQGDKLSIERELDYFNLLVSKLDNPTGIFNFSQRLSHVDVVGVFVNSTYDFSKLFFDIGNDANNLLAGHGPNGQFSLTSAPGDSVDLLVVFQLWFQYNCACVPAEAVMAVLDFYNEVTGEFVLINATGNIVSFISDARPEPFYFEGMGPNEDRGPDMVEILAVYTSSTYNYSLKWHEQANNLYQSYNEANHQITLNSAPGDQEPLIIVMKLNWFCPDTTCDGNLAPVLASHTPNQVIHVSLNDSVDYVLSIKFEDDNINNHGVWKVWMADIFLEDTWSGDNLIINIKLRDHIGIANGLELEVNVDVYDDCNAMSGYDLFVIFSENPPVTTSDDPVTTDDSSNNQTLTTTPGFELFAILLGLPIIGIIARKRD
ncbi:MAG: hypothetical protein ACW99A_21075 [Candidatus Kariarchaeaceae archaeon]|jgi:hypothetical protein